MATLALTLGSVFAGSGAAAAGAGAAAGAAAAGSGLSTALTAASLGLSALGAVSQASSARAAGTQQQTQLDAEAKEAVAVSQREALARRREGALLASRQRAIAAAQGGAADPSVLNLIGQTAAETERAAQSELVRGTTQATGLRYRGQVARQQSKAQARGAILGGFGSVLGGAASAYDRFNAGRFEGTDNKPGNAGYKYG